ncbi:MAG: hypothetical protein AUH25_00210 [Thaumarchaeota archaeon 13_1_40CM_38_12]|nr:MAG: hypothetical protein AUH25_00210 [Thaumarchaeota archaeon 13_1_40CM_38_12]OLC35164.1 MAG: hypothetical protein AUH84_03730 [Thaumarchaeota archaeon 13_1_40CM_4_38_7]
MIVHYPVSMTEYDNFKKQISEVPNKVKTEIRQVGDNAGENLVRTESHSHIQDYNRRAKEMGVVYFDARSKLANIPFQYLWEAGRCYTLGYYISTISLCPAIVEYTWNVDPRLKEINSFIKSIDGWITLGWKNLLVCREKGLPVDELLESDEIKNITTMNTNPRFIDIRNKIDHDEVSKYFKGSLPVTYSTIAEIEAGLQLTRTQKYFVEWHNQLWN